MTESDSSEVVILNFDDQFRLQWLPLRRPLRAPSARAPRRAAREAGGPDEGKHPVDDSLALRGRKRRREASNSGFHG